MSTTLEMGLPHVQWDLSSLFRGMDDPKIAEVWESAAQKSDEFAATYRGRINSPELTAPTLLAALQAAEQISNELAKPMSYANLLFATDSADSKKGAFLAKQRERATELSVKLMFFDLELQAAPESVIGPLLETQILQPYRHYVRTARTYSPFRLSEKEEIVLEETANTGSRAWVRFFEEITANHVYKLHRPGAETHEEITQQELLALIREPDRELRQAAADAFSNGLQELQRPLVFTYNNILQDKSVEDRLRRMEYPEQARHLSNELDSATVDLVIKLCRDHYGLVERFYNVKREILGLEQLTHIDRYAPLFATESRVAWDRGKEIVLEAFNAFDSTMADKAREFFDQQWIDAEPRKGKQGGAFCMYVTPDAHPFVMMNYMNKMDDVMTLAHELGHGVHASLSREQSYFNFQGTLPLAELASTFGEMLVFEKIVMDASQKDRLALFAGKIEGVFATVFRQSAMFRFEQRAHRARREQGELSPEQLGTIWHEELQAMFGSSVALGDQHRTWWMYVGHFIYAPFYVYAYSFGELLVLSLFQMAKVEGPSFAKKYTDVLRLGGAKTPAELMGLLGVDLNSEAFWLGGFRAMESLVVEFERLWGESKNAEIQKA